MSKQWPVNAAQQLLQHIADRRRVQIGVANHVRATKTRMHLFNNHWPFSGHEKFDIVADARASEDEADTKSTMRALLEPDSRHPNRERLGLQMLACLHLVVEDQKLDLTSRYSADAAVDKCGAVGATQRMNVWIDAYLQGWPTHGGLLDRVFLTSGVYIRLDVGNPELHAKRDPVISARRPVKRAFNPAPGSALVSRSVQVGTFPRGHSAA